MGSTTEQLVSSSSSSSRNAPVTSHKKPARYDFSVVWTPIPILTWIFPLIGHTGITTSEGKIRDFAGSYYVAEDNMAFGRPTRRWRCNTNCLKGGIRGWNASVTEASLEYGSRVHNLLCDNCHSHVAMALNLMEYNGKTNWNMFKVACNIWIHGRFVSKMAAFKTFAPTIIIIMVIGAVVCFLKVF